MKLFAAIVAAAALALGAADECTFTTDATTGTGNGCTEAAKCVNSLTLTYTGNMGSIVLPADCAVTGTMENVGVTANAIGGTKDTLTIGYTKAADKITVSTAITGASPVGCVSDATVTAGTCPPASAEQHQPQQAQALPLTLPLPTPSHPWLDLGLLPWLPPPPCCCKLGAGVPCPGGRCKLLPEEDVMYLGVCRFSTCSQIIYMLEHETQYTWYAQVAAQAPTSSCSSLSPGRAAVNF